MDRNSTIDHITTVCYDINLVQLMLRILPPGHPSRPVVAQDLRDLRVTLANLLRAL